MLIVLLQIVIIIEIFEIYKNNKSIVEISTVQCLPLKKSACTAFSLAAKSISKPLEPPAYKLFPQIKVRLGILLCEIYTSSTSI